MFNPLASTTIGALEQTLSFTERRHELLAGNIANSSTPDYRSRDLDVGEFQQALAASIKQGPSKQTAGSLANEPGMLSLTVPGIPAGLLGHPTLSAEAMIASLRPTDSLNRPAPENPQLERIGPTGAITREDQWSGPRAAMEQVIFHDNSDVGMEEQVNQISKNKHMHNLAISTLRNQFDLLKAAITERA